MEKLYNENEGMVEIEGKPEDEAEPDDEGKSDVRKSWKWKGNQAMRESSRMRDSQMMKDNQKVRESKKSRARLKMREKPHSEGKPESLAKAVAEPWAAKKHLAEDYVPRKAKRKMGGWMIPPRTIRRTYRKGTWVSGLLKFCSLVLQATKPADFLCEPLRPLLSRDWGP
ncbi:hypothetical protein GH733_009454 [Mirounga leonina]|nr:hypothetical protein GH733_009454 [Mirounga leonina]